MAILEKSIEFFSDTFGQDEPRRQCFDVSITDDDTSENTESFRVFLELNSLIVHDRIIVHPAVTEICIFDTDGNITCFMVCIITILF